MIRRFSPWMLTVLVVAAVSRPIEAQATRDSNTGMGNPSGATSSTSNYNNYLMTKSQYTLSYKRDFARPNWVSWHLSTAWLGSAPRQDNFRADTTLPSGWYRVSGSSYSGSGFDRGHMCPSADRTGSTTDNSATFLMTNMIPQAPNNNQQGWARLEDYCRSLAQSGKELYIICGPRNTASSSSGGTGSNGFASWINNGNVRVPSHTWKVILILNNGSNDVSRVTSSTRVIAVEMPNNQTVTTNWGIHRISVDTLESRTGYNFFSNVPTSIQSAIESRIDNGPTQ